MDLDAAPYETVRELFEPLSLCYRSLHEVGAASVADGRLLDVLRRVCAFGLSLTRLDVRQESTVHAKALDAITRALDPSFSPIETIREFANRMASDRVRRELSPRRLFQLVTEGGELLSALPHRLDLITESMAANEFQIRMDVPQTHALLDGLRKLANRIFSGLVLAGLIIASAMLLPYRRSLGTVGFWVAGVIGLYMVVSIWLKDRRER